jgi:hypothetical protein
MLPTAREIAAHMPEGWTASAPDGHDNGVYLNGPDNVQLHISYIRVYSSADDRLNISGAPAREEWKQASDYRDRKDFPNARKGITVSVSKSPSQIARDITKRLLPAYLPYVAELRKRLASENDYEARVVTFRAQLLAALGSAGVEHGDHDIYLHLDDGYGTIRVSADSVSFDRFSLPGHLALEIAKVLAKGARSKAPR